MYQPIENYGVVGNLRTCALVGMDGSIDWLCLPRFDSPSVFGAILDDKKAGRFRVSPVVGGAAGGGGEDGGVRCKQFYWPDTNVLVSRFLCAEGMGEVEDFMPVGGEGRGGAGRLVRRVRVVRGRMTFGVECRPAFDYARAAHETLVGKEGVRFTGGGLTIGLTASVPLRVEAGEAFAVVELGEGECASFVLDVVDGREGWDVFPGAEAVEEWFHETVAYWRDWVGKCTYRGRWREMVRRSALALKLLTYEPTGAIVAAATTSLPEGVGGVRNWDYRYTWIRDASFTLYGLLRVGFTEEAVRFMDWLSARWREGESHTAGPLQLMYSIEGKSDLVEEELPHLEGYRGSRPVRVGNAAHAQLQLDIYGELMDSVYLFNKHAAPVGYDSWVRLRRLVDWVAENWHRPDEGVWEVRGGERHFVYSKFMCWVALDRGIRLADKRSFPADRDKWLKARDEVYQEVMTKGWCRERQAFVQSYGSDALDAACLLMPLVFFTAPNDPRMLRTIDAIKRPVSQGGLSAGGLVYRYDPGLGVDGLPGAEGTFNMCSFWLVEALTRAGRTDPKRLDEARMLFEQMLGYANHLGLYAEQTGASGEALGNFPQAFTHLALISAAFNLDRALDGK